MLGGSGFRQELDLATGTITVSQGDFKAALWFAGETLIFESTSTSFRFLEAREMNLVKPSALFCADPFTVERSWNNQTTFLVLST